MIADLLGGLPEAGSADSEYYSFFQERELKMFHESDDVPTSANHSHYLLQIITIVTLDGGAIIVLVTFILAANLAIFSLQ